MHLIPIDEVYGRNLAADDRLRTLVASIEPAKLHILPEGEKWSIANVVEHVSLVEEGMIKICAKLLAKAESSSQPANGSIQTSDEFGQKALEIAKIKLEAPDFVLPTCQRSVGESMRRLDESRQTLTTLQALFEKFDSNGHRFPHPYLGNLSAGEWLTLIGGHKLRHIKQIENLSAQL